MEPVKQDPLMATVSATAVVVSAEPAAVVVDMGQVYGKPVVQVSVRYSVRDITSSTVGLI
jgi:hypothetical protein